MNLGQYRVLIVDDDQALREMLGRYLEHLGYTIQLAADAADAIRISNAVCCDAVVTDLRMPGPDGMQLLGWITAHCPDTAVVILTGCDEAGMAVRAMKSGAQDYLTKPPNFLDLGDKLASAIQLKAALAGRERYLAVLESSLERRGDELQSTLCQLREASEETLEALVTALDAREQETQAHSQRVSEYSVYLARELGVSEQKIEVIRQGSMLHDIGKIGIPDRILLKPDRLTEQEWVEMRRHPEIGSSIVSGVESLRPASDIVIAHHERFDGSGYPRGLSGKEIPLGARVFAVADCLDAVLSDRPYRSGQPFEHAREEIAQNAGSQFDPGVADCFLHTDPAAWLAIRDRSAAKQSTSLVLT